MFDLSAFDQTIENLGCTDYRKYSSLVLVPVGEVLVWFLYIYMYCAVCIDTFVALCHGILIARCILLYFIAHSILRRRHGATWCCTALHVFHMLNGQYHVAFVLEGGDIPSCVTRVRGECTVSFVFVGGLRCTSI